MPLPRAITTGLFLIGALLTSGCSDPEPTYPVALCGAEAYEVLPAEEVGQVVQSEEITMLDLDASGIEGLVSATPLKVLGPARYGTRVFKLRYRTQDRGVSVDATAAVAYPANADLPAELPLLIYTHGTTGFSDPCAPANDIVIQIALGAIAAQGYIVIAPDFLGLTSLGESVPVRHPYLIGEPTAFASWDATRAAVALAASEGLQAVPARRVAIMGASQGGHAAFFVSRYGPHYAPEFQVEAVLPSIPPIDLPELIAFAVDDDSNMHGLMAAMLNAYRHWYGRPTTMEGVLTNVAPDFLADSVDQIMYPTENCDAGDQLSAIHQAGSLYDDAFTADLRSGTPPAPWDCYLEVNSINTTPIPKLIDPPVFVVAGELDELVPLTTVTSGMEELCGDGYGIELVICQDAGHVNGGMWSLGEQVAWLEARMAGEPMDRDRSCVVPAPTCCSGSPAATCTP